MPTPAQKTTSLGALPGEWQGLNRYNDFAMCAKYSGSCPVTKSLGKKWNLGLERSKDTASEVRDKQPGAQVRSRPRTRVQLKELRPLQAKSMRHPEPSAWLLVAAL